MYLPSFLFLLFLILFFLSLSLSVYVNSCEHFAPRCGDYITACATVRKNPPTDSGSPSLSLSVLHFTNTFRDTRYIAHNCRRHCRAAKRRRRHVDVWRLIRFTAVTTAPPCTRIDYRPLRLSTQQWLTTTRRRPGGARVPSLCCGMQRSRRRRIYPCTTMARQLVNTQLNVLAYIPWVTSAENRDVVMAREAEWPPMTLPGASYWPDVRRY